MTLALIFIFKLGLSDFGFNLVKCDGAIGLSVYYFQVLFNSNMRLNWPPLFHISLQNRNIALTLTFQGHTRSNVMVTLDSPYMVSC